ncbi:MAG TPA: hypothetical protein VE956_07830 [Nodularia sp. (in: cyanobacteria)]|nr:hypothetical protein [Nodularia sp. (in: cyanobacteria)]
MSLVTKIIFSNIVCAIAYDFLVLATGSKTQYLGVTGASEYAFPTYASF